jgi:hypothetical protein
MFMMMMMMMMMMKRKGKSKANPIQDWTGPRRFRLPELIDTQHLKVAWLSALRTDRLYPSGDIPDSHFC